MLEPPPHLLALAGCGDAKVGPSLEHVSLADQLACRLLTDCPEGRNRSKNLENGGAQRLCRVAAGRRRVRPRLPSAAGSESGDG